MRIDPYGRAEEEPLSPDEYDAEAIKVFDVQGPIDSGTTTHIWAHENPDAWRLVREQEGEERYRELRRVIAEDYTVPAAVGLARVERPVAGHVRVTEHGVQHVRPHTREVEVDLDAEHKSRAPTSVRVVDTREFEETEEGTFKAISGSGSPRQCDRCGRHHEVHVFVTYPDKEVCVGTGCANDAEAPIVKRIVSTQKSLSSLERQLARAEQRLIEWERVKTEVEALQAPPVEQDEEWDGKRQTFRMGEQRVWQHDPGPITEERLSVLQDSWREARFTERDQKSYSHFITDEIERLRKRIAAAQKKLASASDT